VFNIKKPDWQKLYSRHIKVDLHQPLNKRHVFRVLSRILIQRVEFKFEVVRTAFMAAEVTRHINFSRLDRQTKTRRAWSLGASWHCDPPKGVDGDAVSPVPSGYRTLTPYLIVDGAIRALAW
jgi:hypothetical protein